MTSPLDNLLKVSKGGLKQEASSQSEFDGLVRSAKRNLAEYEGNFDVDVQLLRELDTVAGQLEAAVEALGPIKPSALTGGVSFVP